MEECSRCGDFQIDRNAPPDFLREHLQGQQRALASHLIRRMQGTKPPILSPDFFASLSGRKLPTPAEMSDNLLQLIAERVEGRPGTPISIDLRTEPSLAASIGGVDPEDVLWAIRNLLEEGLLKGQLLDSSVRFANGYLTARGWDRIEELKRAHVASRYAFFARKFANDELNTLYEKCLKQAIADTGFELRTVTQKAGHIDAIIEDEIRRCRFLLADLSDDNAGAYWEAGFAEGLGKPVIYICRDGKKTHFDTEYRHTVRWDLNKLAETAKHLKAIIRNTLLGDAKQDD
jgi:nucleoside 2-deoxyribosyltransferase